MAVIPCIDCGTDAGFDEDDWPIRVKGPGCRLCKGEGELPTDMVVWSPRMLLSPTVGDLLHHMATHRDLPGGQHD